MKRFLAVLSFFSLFSLSLIANFDKGEFPNASPEYYSPKDSNKGELILNERIYGIAKESQEEADKLGISSITLHYVQKKSGLNANQFSYLIKASYTGNCFLCKAGSLFGPAVFDENLIIPNWNVDHRQRGMKPNFYQTEGRLRRWWIFSYETAEYLVFPKKLSLKISDKVEMTADPSCRFYCFPTTLYQKDRTLLLERR